LELFKRRTAAAICIQKIIRGCLARKRYRERKILKKLNPKLQHLADEYIINGKFWDFMDAVNDSFNRFEYEAKMEEESALTFIKGYICLCIFCTLKVYSIFFCTLKVYSIKGKLRRE
jgi:hypothetical protein